MFLDDKPQGEVTELDEVSKLLLKAAEILERDGWCQGYIGAVGGPACIEGALQIAAGNPPGMIIRPNSAVYEATVRIHKAVYLPAYEWNDESMRTKKEVVATLRTVALNK